MRSRESLVFLGLLTAFCLLGGVVFGVATGGGLESRPGPTTATMPLAVRPTHAATAVPAMPLASVTPGPQRAVLIILVDDADAASPQLQGLWAITFRPGVPEYYGLGFAPTATFTLESLSGEQSLAEIFAEDQRLQLGYRFVHDAVEARFPALSVKVDVLLEPDDVAALVERVGGLPLDGEVLTGGALLRAYQDTLADPDERVAFQGQVLQAMFAVLRFQRWTPARLAEYVKAMPRMRGDAARAASLDLLVAGAPPLAESNLTWRPYNPDTDPSE